MEIFVFFKNGEDSNDFSRESSKKSSWKAVVNVIQRLVVVSHSQQLIKF